MPGWLYSLIVRVSPLMKPLILLCLIHRGNIRSIQRVVVRIHLSPPQCKDTENVNKYMT